ncbi:Aste57867_1240 [Aphanomyces stellatus]|uniref:Aste57867_1240 protein n=1 Tax=Aphanomyces stellatus TaxID=120398 RepID=A0A485K9T5_9STRA|nr:hypothetical protein As57867_001239 [Aphanomyces stellatus]VFT78459.1 Aste57867_1240 [Aphanomyces stellatus]
MVPADTSNKVVQVKHEALCDGNTKSKPSTWDLGGDATIKSNAMDKWHLCWFLTRSSRQSLVRHVIEEDASRTCRVDSRAARTCKVRVQDPINPVDVEKPVDECTTDSQSVFAPYDYAEIGDEVAAMFEIKLAGILAALRWRHHDKRQSQGASWRDIKPSWDQAAAAVVFSPPTKPRSAKPS